MRQQRTSLADSDSVDNSVMEDDPEFFRYEEGGDFMKDPRIVKLLQD